MTVDEFAKLLLDKRVQLLGDGYYKNKSGQVGYRASYRHPQTYCWYSVSASDYPISADEVASAITQHGSEILRENSYRNRNDVRGFEATVRSEDHHFMLGAAPDPPRFSHPR